MKPNEGSRDLRCRGFTLVELIVASGITVGLAVLLLGATSNILDSWNRTRGKLTTSNQAKLALDQLADDLESVVLRADGNVWFAATVSGPQTGQGDANITGATYISAKPTDGSGTTNLSPASLSITDYRFGHVGVWLRFFATQPNSNDDMESVSAPRAIAYQLARLPVSAAAGNPPSYFLFRSAVRPFDEDGSASTIATGYDIVGNNAFNDGTSSGSAEPGSVRTPDRTLIVANDVVDFGVRIYTRGAGGNLVERFPVDRAGGGADPVWSFLATSAIGVVPHGVGAPPSGVTAILSDFPAVIDVMVRVLTDEGARLILALESGKIVPPNGPSNFDAYWWELAEANSAVFMRRVEVQSRPLAIR